jgi:CheY-like chemotaxis protein
MVNPGDTGPAKQGGKAPARILVVDDEPSVREFVARALQHAGHEVDTAVDGLEALERQRAYGLAGLIHTVVPMPFSRQTIVQAAQDFRDERR